MLADLLETDGVEETVELRGRVGFLAIHGGGLEKVTDVIAGEAAYLADASYYGVTQPKDLAWHVPSKHFDPDASDALADFLDHIDYAIAIHGYGRKHLRWVNLLGGRNRPMAAHVAAHLESRLPAYEFCHDLDAIPAELAGQHPRNPVNLPSGTGVQIELCPLARWHWEGWDWSDHGTVGRAPQVDALVRGLAEAARSWPGSLTE